MSPTSFIGPAPAPRRSARLAAKPLKRYISPWTEWRRATYAKSRELRSAAAAPAPVAAPTPAPAAAAPPRRSARLAAKAAAAKDAQNLSYSDVRSSLLWYLDNIESSQSRAAKVFWATHTFKYVIKKLTGPSRVESFVLVVQNSEKLHSVLMDKCHTLIRDITIQPSCIKKLDEALIKNCKMLLEILTEMKIKVISQAK